MNQASRRKYQMFVRVRNFGVANGDVFPETSPAGVLFAELATHIASIEAHFVRREQARAEARKLNRETRAAAHRVMKAIAATGRRAAREEAAQHLFRLPDCQAATEVLGAARLLREEAERRKARFLRLGMRPTFLDDYDRVIEALAGAVNLQQDSRSSRRRVNEALAQAFDAAAAVVADLDVTVPNQLDADSEWLAGWFGARRVDRARASGGRAVTDGGAVADGAAVAHGGAVREVVPSSSPAEDPSMGAALKLAS